jgi:DNA-binding transcriptional LysR family regulator
LRRQARSRTRSSHHLLQASGKIDLALAVPDVMSIAPIVRWSAPLLWVASREFIVDPAKPLPLVTISASQSPWLTGPHPWDHRILNTLEKQGLRWGVACSTTTVASMLAAVEAGIGISYFTRESLRPTLRVLNELDGMPSPIIVEFGLFTPDGKNSPNLAPLIDVLTRTVM